MSTPSRSTAVLAGLLLFCIGAFVVAACTGDDPVLTNGGGGDGGGGDGGGGDGDGGPVTEADAGGDGPAGCGDRDTTPCGCKGGAMGCCIGNGVAVCVPSGTGTPADGCGSTSTLDCVGTTCGGGQVCCYNGSVSQAAVCPMRMTAFDTRCAPIDADGGPQCVELPGTPSARLHELTCISSDDCTPYDAGTCVSALMDGVNRVIGICVR